MHEQAIAQEILRQAKRAAQNQDKSVKGMVVEVGDLGHLPAHEMEEVFKTLVPNWQVTIKKKPAIIECACGYTGEPDILEKGHDHNVFRCPECKTMMPDILEGDKIVLVSVDVE